MQAELVELTWLDDDRLLTIADSTMPDEDQQRMAELSNHEGLAPTQHDEFKALRDSCGKMTLRKARAGIVERSQRKTVAGRCPSRLMVDTIPRNLRHRVAIDARHRCGYCLTDQGVSGAQMHIEHIIPARRL